MTYSRIVDIILYTMKTKHLLTATFGIGLIVLISNTGLAFAVVVHTSQYNAGYAAACSDSKSGIRIWENDGFIWEGFNDKYPAIQNNHDWMQGYRDGSICTHKHTPQYVAGFTAGCHDKNAGLLLNDENGFATIENTTRYPSTQNDTVWIQGFYDAIIDTTFCHQPKTK